MGKELDRSAVEASQTTDSREFRERRWGAAVSDFATALKARVGENNSGGTGGPDAGMAPVGGGAEAFDALPVNRNRRTRPYPVGPPAAAEACPEVWMANAPPHARCLAERSAQFETSP